MLVDILTYMNLTFTLFFSIECVLKLIAFGPGVSTYTGRTMGFTRYGANWADSATSVIAVLDQQVTMKGISFRRKEKECPYEFRLDICMYG